MIGPYEPGALVECVDDDETSGLLRAGQRYTVSGRTWDRRGIFLREVPLPKGYAGFKVGRFLPVYDERPVQNAQSVLDIYAACIARDGPPKQIKCGVVS